MKGINIQTKNLNTIKIALFIATELSTLKGSEIWDNCNQLLNWICRFDQDDTIIICNNPDIKIEIKEK